MTAASTCALAINIRTKSTRWTGPKSLSTFTVIILHIFIFIWINLRHLILKIDKEDEKYLLVSTPYNDGPRDVQSGKSATFVVYVDARPDPEVNWYKDGDPETINTTSKFVVHRSWGKTYLKIRDATVADSGVYRLVATSGNVRRSVNFTLIVEESN